METMTLGTPTGRRPHGGGTDFGALGPPYAKDPPETALPVKPAEEPGRTLGHGPDAFTAGAFFRAEQAEFLEVNPALPGDLIRQKLALRSRFIPALQNGGVQDQGLEPLPFNPGLEVSDLRPLGIQGGDNGDDFITNGFHDSLLNPPARGGHPRSMKIKGEI